MIIIKIKILMMMIDNDDDNIKKFYSLEMVRQAKEIIFECFKRSKMFL